MNRPRRIAVVGNSGSGKTTMAREIAARLGCEHVELDGIHHLPNWTPIERDRMRAIVADHVRADAWVIDGNYRSLVQDLVFARADTVVWLDLPRRVVMMRVIRRTMGRVLRRRELWNGNREHLRNLLRRDPEENIILWSWTQHCRYRAQYEEARDHPSNREITWVRLTSTRGQRKFLGVLSVSDRR
jgi:adenylate kinase family enzyme